MVELGGRSLREGDVVARGDDVGVIVGRRPYEGPVVWWLPAGPERLVQSETLTVVIPGEALAQLARVARDHDEMGA